MILVEHPSKPFQYTPKSTVRRQFVISEYEKEIDDLYGAVEANAQSAVPAPDEWTTEATLDFVRKVVTGVMKKAVDDGADVFQHGCDRSVPANG